MEKILESNNIVALQFGIGNKPIGMMFLTDPTTEDIDEAKRFAANQIAQSS